MYNVYSHNLLTHKYRSNIQLQLQLLLRVEEVFFCGLAQQIADHTAWSRFFYRLELVREQNYSLL